MVCLLFFIIIHGCDYLVFSPFTIIVLLTVVIFCSYFVSPLCMFFVFFFFFQAEDGIRDKLVTGVQTCALPISRGSQRSRSATGRPTSPTATRKWRSAPRHTAIARSSAARSRTKPASGASRMEIGRASCRERV